jgi:vancomycin permeability regulator SanA
MKKILKWSFFSVVSLLLIWFLLSSIVYFKTRTYRSDKIDSLQEQKVAIIFGARIYSNGQPSPFLKDRVDGGIALYRAGKVQKLLMSGDNRVLEYDEVTAMKKYAIAQGMPAGDIVLDYAGFSTYETCYRAKEIFGVNSAILVTQDYHLPRAVYTCRKLGLDATGFAQPDWSRYKDAMPRTMFREYLAHIKMFIDLYITKPLPTFLGQKENID